MPVVLFYVLPWKIWPVDSQGMPDRVGGWDKGMSGGIEGWRRKYAQSVEDEGVGEGTTARGLLQS